MKKFLFIEKIYFSNFKDQELKQLILFCYVEFWTKFTLYLIIIFIIIVQFKER